MSDHAFCSVDPANITMLRAFGWVFVAALVISLATGHSYYRRVFSRDTEPRMYWSAVASYLVLAVFILGGLSLCG
ncbi:MAG: hypothetical protein IBJ03_10530 [Gemmatimonadaceae bacterium]|nr:hypothetical protein [Gemmatimonadaceae bacterium]